MKFSITLLFLLLTGVALEAQVNYFISNNGDDSNDGSIQSPWKTIRHGIAALVPGDTLNLREGTYYEKVDFDVAGTPGAYITLRGYPGEAVQISGANSPDETPLLYTESAYQVIENIHFTNNQHNYASGIALQGTAHHIIIRDNRVSQITFSRDLNSPVTYNTNAVPINMWADTYPDSMHHISILSNEVFDNRTGYSENISGSGNLSEVLIEGNSVHDNTNIGIDLGGHYRVVPQPEYDQARHAIIRGNLVYNNVASYSNAAGIYIDGGRDIVVENNISHHNGYGGEIGCEENGATERISFRNNIFYKNEVAGMHIGGYDPNTTGIVRDFTVTGNTFYANDTKQTDNGELLFSLFERGTIHNNIFYVDNPAHVWMYSDRSQTGLKMDYNLLYLDDGSGQDLLATFNNKDYEGLASFYRQTGLGRHDIFGDPSFKDLHAPLPDFHLTNSSPAIDQGNPSYIAAPGEKDLDGEARIIHQRVDIGADEYASGNSTVPIWDIGQRFHTTPNPGMDYIYIVPDPGAVYYTLYDIKGRPLYEGCYTGKIAIGSLSKGIYALQIMEDKKKNSNQVVWVMKW